MAPGVSHSYSYMRGAFSDELALWVLLRRRRLAAVIFSSGCDLPVVIAFANLRNADVLAWLITATLRQVQFSRRQSPRPPPLQASTGVLPFVCFVISELCDTPTCKFQLRCQQSILKKIRAVSAISDESHIAHSSNRSARAGAGGVCWSAPARGGPAGLILR